MKCCRESFLAAAFTGSKGSSYIRVSAPLIDNLIDFLSSSEIKNSQLKVKGCRVYLTNIDIIRLRKNYVERFYRFEVGSDKPKHCQTAFMQGIFLSHGYVQNPGQGYHLEIRIKSRWLKAAFLKTARALKMRFSSFKKKNYYIFYTKSSRRIIKFLKKMGVFTKALELSDFIATRKILSRVNRQVNSETANINRIVSAAEKSILRINKLLNYSDQDFWTAALKETALLRLKYPYDSIEKLGSRFVPHLSKSAVNHRLRRINSLYQKLFPERK
ncbi:MAG: DNA-binding protein WhiA [Candidatus Rifleibacteriota bacterium]